MKKFKVSGIILAVTLAIVPAVRTYASGLFSAGKYQVKAEPTPAAGRAVVENMENNTTASLSSEIGDYDGRIKQTKYVINGDEWTVVMKVGASFANEKLPDGMSEYELVYQETCEPNMAMFGDIDGYPMGEMYAGNCNIAEPTPMPKQE